MRDDSRIDGPFPEDELEWDDADRYVPAATDEETGTYGAQAVMRDAARGAPGIERARGEAADADAVEQSQPWAPLQQGDDPAIDEATPEADAIEQSQPWR